MDNRQSVLRFGMYAVTVRFATPRDPEWSHFEPRPGRFGGSYPDLFGLTEYTKLVILVAPCLSKERIRATIYHELGHFFAWTAQSENTEAHANDFGQMLAESRAYDWLLSKFWT